MKGEIKVTVDRANFMELARVFQRNRRLFRATNVILTLGDGQLRIDFNGGGCVLPCECPQPLVAELAASGFSGIALEHRHEKSAAKTIQLTFRPELGEFATSLAGAKAKIKLTR